MYKISVIIPTYNRVKYIKRSIESVFEQKDQGINYEISEVIVVDDGSTDDTEREIKKAFDKKVVFHRMERNSGAAAARNKGVEIARAEWIAFQDSDDIWHRDKIKKQVEYIMNNPQIDMVSHPIRERFDNGDEIITDVLSTDDCVPYLAQKNYYGTPTMLVKREAFMDAGAFDPELRALEDWEFALRFSDKYKIGMVEEVLIDSQMTSGGVSSGAANYYEGRCRMIAGNKEILLKHDCFDDAVRSLLAHAGRNGVLDMVGKMLELSLKSI